MLKSFIIFLLFFLQMKTMENRICTKQIGDDIKESKICAAAGASPQYTGNFTCNDESEYLFNAYGEPTLWKCNPCPSNDCNSICYGSGSKLDPLFCVDAPAKYQSTCNGDSGGKTKITNDLC